MEEEIKGNPDYQLVMRFLQLIKPGDMDEQSANQMMMIGQRIQNGGTLSDKEREMFQSVVGAMPMDPNSAVREGEMSYQVDDRMERMTPSEYAAAVESGQITPDQLMMESSGSTMTDAERIMAEEDAYFKRLRKEQEQMYNMSQEAMRQQMQGSAPMTSPRPMARPTRQEAIMAEVNVENMEENAELFMEKMGFPHDAEGLEMSDDQLVNFLLLCHQMQYGMMHDDEEEMYEEEEMMMPHGNDVKVKVMKLDGGNVHEMMNELLGG